MENKPYFPPLHGRVECDECEKSDCPSRGKYQRNRRDFTYTSGRCPRLPDDRGFMEKDEQELYAAASPVVYAERGGDDSLFLTLTIPGEKRKRRVYHTKICGGWWYFRGRSPEYSGPVKRVVTIEGKNTKQEILDYMDQVNTDYCALRCEIEDLVL